MVLGLALPCICFHSQSCSDPNQSLWVRHHSGFAGELTGETCYTAGSGVKTVRSDPVTDLQHLSDLEHSLYLPQEFLGAAVTNNHGWGGLEQQKYILSWFWKPGVQNEAVIRGCAPAKPLGGGQMHPCLFQLQVAPGVPELVATALLPCFRGHMASSSSLKSPPVPF